MPCQRSAAPSSIAGAVLKGWCLPRAWRHSGTSPDRFLEALQRVRARLRNPPVSRESRLGVLRRAGLNATVTKVLTASSPTRPPSRRIPRLHCVARRSRPWRPDTRFPRPRLHQPPPSFQEIRPRAGGLRLVPDRVSERPGSSCSRAGGRGWPTAESMRLARRCFETGVDGAAQPQQNGVAQSDRGVYIAAEECPSELPPR